MAPTNWGGNYEYNASTIHRPSSLAHVAELVSASTNVRVLGSRHSFTDLADAGELIDLGSLPEIFEIDPSATSVRVSANMTYGRFAELAGPHAVALHNLASLPHITIAGAIATATHGSGSGNGNLATAVSSIEIMTADGSTITSSRGDADFAGLVVGLGAFGVVTALTLDVEPAYDIAQYVFEGIEWATLTDSFDEIFSAGHSVSVFSRYGATAEALWVKSRTDDPRRADYISDSFFGAPKATQRRHPIMELSAENCTVQQGIAGPWIDRLPHFQMGFSPSAGDEIQSEFFVPIEFGPPAIQALLEIAPELDGALLVGEIRTVAADELWMSPQYNQATAAFHFTWKLDQAAAERAAAAVARALAPFNVLPHWGKVFPTAMPAVLAIPKRHDFLDLVRSLDPQGVFANQWMQRHLANE